MMENNSTKHQRKSEPLPSILVVENDFMCQITIDQMLRSLNCEVDIANNGEDAAMKVVKNNYDLLFIDISLPGLNGIKSTYKIQGITDKKIPAIAITSSSMERTKIKEKEMDQLFDSIISKPVNFSDLKLVISNYFNNTESAPKNPLNYDIKKVSEELGIQEVKLKKYIDMLFNDKINTYLKTLDTAITENDLNKIEPIAHKIKGTVANFRLVLMQNILEKIERKARDGIQDNYRKYFIELENTVNKYRRIIIGNCHE